MNNVTTKTKIILFAILIVALIVPISYLEMVDAATSADKKNDSKDKKYNYEKKTNFVKKDLHNYEADKILQKMDSFVMTMPDSDIGVSAPFDRKEMDKLQKELEKVTKEHKDKIIDKELRKDLKKARQLIKDSGIPTNILATGIDHLYIKLSKENAKYEEQIIEIMNELPYIIEYGEGIQRSWCQSTSSNCNYEIGGIKIQTKGWLFDLTCTLSIPMKKDGVPGFLTAAHCFGDENADNVKVYQPDTSSESNILGYSDSNWRSFVDDGECDCAWIKDTSSTQQRAGVYAFPNAYWATFTTHVPTIGELAMLRGFENNNGEFYWANTIRYDDISISDWWGLGKTTVNMMAFVSPSQPGDSGGTVFFGSNYIGIDIGYTTIDNKKYVVFVPWDHITENISGLSLNPHP